MEKTMQKLTTHCEKHDSQKMTHNLWDEDAMRARIKDMWGDNIPVSAYLDLVSAYQPIGPAML